MILLTATLWIMLIFSYFWIKYLIERNEMSTRYKVLNRQQDKINLYEVFTVKLLKQCREAKAENKRIKHNRAAASYRVRETKKDCKRLEDILKGLQANEDEHTTNIKG